MHQGNGIESNELVIKVKSSTSIERAGTGALEPP